MGQAYNVLRFSCFSTTHSSFTLPQSKASLSPEVVFTNTATMATHGPVEKELGVDELERADTGRKVSIDHSDKSNADLDERINAFSPAEQKRIIRHVDRRLVLTLGFLYCVSLMDRTNLGIAVVAGMGVDLVLIGERYSIIVLLFFITYVLLQPPATVVLRKVGPRIFLPTITLLWGLTMIAFGFVKNWTDLIYLRLILGVFEAGFFPGRLPMDIFCLVLN
jgi:hypothetical protein